MFGSIISATDPVAVVVLLKELGASRRLATMIEGESLLNDGTAMVVGVDLNDHLSQQLKVRGPRLLELIMVPIIK